MDFSHLLSNGKSGGPGPRRVDRAARLGSMVDRGGADKRAQWRLAGVRCVGARAHWCSPVAAKEDELDKAALEGCSPKHERQQRGGVTEVKNDGYLSSARGRRKVRGSSGERGK
jgi:hypothetical protein